MTLGRGCVLVTDSCPVFGFATSETLIKSKDTNAGLRDQRAALECTYLCPPGSQNEKLKYRTIRGSR